MERVQRRTEIRNLKIPDMKKDRHRTIQLEEINGNVVVIVLLDYTGLLQRGRDSFVLPIH